MKYFIYLGRLHKLISIQLPDDKSRMAIFQVYLTKTSVAEDIDMNYLVSETKGYNGADLSNICQQAYILATQELKIKFS